MSSIALDTQHAHEWKRAQSHVNGLRMVADGLARGQMTPERAAEVLREYTTWLDKDLGDLKAQQEYETAQAELSGLRRGRWEASLLWPDTLAVPEALKGE